MHPLVAAAFSVGTGSLGGRGAAGVDRGNDGTGRCRLSHETQAARGASGPIRAASPAVFGLALEEARGWAAPAATGRGGRSGTGYCGGRRTVIRRGVAVRITERTDRAAARFTVRFDVAILVVATADASFSHVDA